MRFELWHVCQVHQLIYAPADLCVRVCVRMCVREQGRVPHWAEAEGYVEISELTHKHNKLCRVLSLPWPT